MFIIFFFFNDTATTEIYTLSLHDALPICIIRVAPEGKRALKNTGNAEMLMLCIQYKADSLDRKSTRLNSSHANISYAVFCLKKKQKILKQHQYVDTSDTTCCSTRLQVNRH